MIWWDGRLRSLVAVSWLAGFIVLPEGLAAPYAEQIGAGDAAVGALVVSRWCPPEWRLRLMRPMAIAAIAVLLGFAAQPGLAVAMALLAVSGICGSYQVIAAATFMQLIPDAERGQAYGLAGSGLKAAQGLGIAAGGVLAQAVGAAGTAIALAAATGTVVAALATVVWWRNGLRTVRDSP